ncbi:MAG: hypothetical protein QME96_08170 [Myxococcota bacterium]|nr:hypothetical protein [Myxococcota bacterium]
MSRSPCRVVGETAHFSPFGPLPAGDPPSQPAQNYFVESILGGFYHHQPQLYFRDFRSDGLSTRGTSRFLHAPTFCLVGRADLHAEVQAVLTDAVAKLTGGHLAATFADSASCFSGTPCDRDCVAGPAGQVTVYLEGCGAQGVACYSDGVVGKARGSEITGGFLLAGTLGASLDASTTQTIRHELGHVFGLAHTWGDSDMMSYRDRTLDYAAHEIEAFALLYDLDVGLGIRDLIAMGVIEDLPSVLREPPMIVHTEISGPGERPLSADGGREPFRNHAAVDDVIYVVGQRLTVPFGTDPLMSFRALGYAPPVVRFGSVDLVADLSAAFQSIPTRWVGWPTGIMKTRVPVGAGGLLTTTRSDGPSATLGLFTVDGPSVPNPAQTPLPVASLACSRPVAGLNALTWALPATFADGTTPFRGAGAHARVFRNAALVGELAGDTTSFTDPTLYPAHEADLYQIILVDDATGQVGIPSRICRLSPRASGSEVTLLVLDETGSMSTPRADGTTRFQGVVGPLPAPQVPRALATLDEVFAGTSPRVGVYSFSLDFGVIDEVAALTGETFTSDRAVAEAAIAAVRTRGTDGLTPMVDTICISASFLQREFIASGAERATLRIFTDGQENFSIGVPECPASCVAPGGPGTLPWDLACRPGPCPAASPVSCTACQVDLFREYCASPLNFFVEYFGPAGPFSPLPPDAGYLFDLARATGGRFTHNGDDGSITVGLAGDPPPIADAGETLTAECAGPEGTPVTLQGAALDALPYAALRFVWTGPFFEGGGTAEGDSVSVTFPPGAHVVQLVVYDEHQESLPAYLEASVVDSTPPDLDVVLSPNELWPPNHNLRRITAQIQAGDVCSPDDVRVQLVSIRSNEPDDALGGGDGSTSPDVVGAEFGTDDREFFLRAERLGAGSGRVYTVTYEAEDATGNRTRTEATVSVPHNR